MTLEHILTYLKSQPDHESDTQTACKALKCGKKAPAEFARKNKNTLITWVEEKCLNNKVKRTSFIAIHPHIRQQWNAEKGLIK